MRELIHQGVGPNEKIKRGQIKLTEPLVEFEDVTKSVGQILLRGTPPDGFSQRLKRPKHLRKALLKHGQEQLESPEDPP